MQNQTLCIYHGNCADGFAAACVVKMKYAEIDFLTFVAGVYQQQPPDVKGKHVILVDFSYKRPVMEKILADAESVTILDHHKTAIEDLEGLAFTDSLLDVDRSGAMLTWQYMFPNKTVPRLIKHIQDRDLWQFKLPGTREIQAALFSYEYDFDTWIKLIEDDDSGRRLREEGVAIERKHFKDIRELLKVCRRKMEILGVSVNAANLPYTLSSDAGHIMVTEEDQPFGCCYYDSADGRNFSLRSDEKHLDVSEIAKQFGGGGHRNAAGFRVSFPVAATFEREKS